MCVCVKEEQKKIYYCVLEHRHIIVISVFLAILTALCGAIVRMHPIGKVSLSLLYGLMDGD